jgi:hypothetical protein
VQIGLHVMLARSGGPHVATPALESFWCHRAPLSALPHGPALAGWPPAAQMEMDSWPMIVAHLFAAAAAGTWMHRGDAALAGLLGVLSALALQARALALPLLRPVTGWGGASRVPASWLPTWRPRRLQLVRTSAARRGPPVWAC